MALDIETSNVFKMSRDKIECDVVINVAMVWIALGNMVLMNAGRELDDCDIGFYGPLFERAQELGRVHRRITTMGFPPITVHYEVLQVLWEAKCNMANSCEVFDHPCQSGNTSPPWAAAIPPSNLFVTAGK